MPQNGSVDDIQSGADARTPYADLTPERVLDAVDAVGLVSDGRLLALNSYENRVFQVGVEDGPSGAFVVVKFYRPGRWSEAQILEEHAFVAALADDEIPAVPPLVLQGRTLHRFGDHRLAVFARRGGRAPNLDDPEALEWLGRFIARIHRIGARERFRARPALDPDTFGRDAIDHLLGHDAVDPSLRRVWEGVAREALAGVEDCWARAGDVRTLRLHGDCHEGNVLWTDAGPHFVDFDDARTGPAIQDLWMLIGGDRAEMTRKLGHLLDGYEQFEELDRRELHLVEALRTLRLLHHSAWIAERWADPAFPAAFPWFASPRYWEAKILELREQVAAMQEPPLAV